MAEQMRSDPMEVDTDVHAQPSSPPAEKIPGAFNSTTPNGANGTANKDSMDVDSGAPTPPPHKSPPTSPVAAAPPTPEEAEAFKNAGNKHYKAKEYRKAIEEYTKGTIIRRTHSGNIILTIL
jgi:DnaJ family protein C protein 7